MLSILVHLILFLPLSYAEDSLIILGNALLLQSNSNWTYNYVSSISLNNQSQDLLFDLNSPILWYENKATQDSSVAFNLTYKNENVNGNFTTDNNISIANVNLTNQRVGSVNSTSFVQDLFGYNPGTVSGVFGHSYFNTILGSLNSTTGFQNKFLLRPFAKYDQPLQINSSPVSSDNIRGVVIYGDIDELLINGNVYFTSVLFNKDYYWLIGVSAISSSNSSLQFDNNLLLDDGTILSTKSRAAVIDLTNYIDGEPVLLITPTEDAFTIHKSLSNNDFTFSNATGEFLIDCNSQASLQLNIGANVWNITPELYIGKPFRDLNRCISNIRAFYNYDFPIYDYPNLVLSNYWLLGAAFFQNISLVFEVDEKLVGLSVEKSTRPLNIITDPQLIKLFESNSTSNATITTISSIFTQSVSLNYESSYATTTTVVENLILLGTLESSFLFGQASPTSSTKNNQLKGFPPSWASHIYIILALLI